MKRLYCLILAITLAASFARPYHVYAQGTTGPAGGDLLFEDQLVMTASKKLQRISEAPALVFVVTREEIERRGYRTVSDALRGIAALHVSYDRVWETLGVRGFGTPGDFNTHILVLLDGHTINEDWAAYAPIGTDLGVDIDLIDRIEVVLGPGSALYGSNAFFAVINILTRPAADVGAIATVEAASFDTYRSHVAFGRKLAELEMLASATWLDAAGPDLSFAEFAGEEGSGRTSGTDFTRLWSSLLKVSYKDFQLLAKGSERRKGMPTAPFDTVFGSDYNEVRDTRHFVEMKAHRDFGEKLDLMGRLYYDYYRYDDYLDYGEDGKFRDIGTDHWGGGELQVNWTPHTRDRVTVGGELKRHQVSQAAGLIGEEGIHLSTDFTYGAIYVQNDWQVLDRLTVITGLHYSRSSLFASAFTPRLALILRPVPATTFKLLYGTGFRNPSVYEAYFEDGIDLIANPELDSETVRTAELVWEQRLGSKSSIFLSAFRSDVRDLIVQVPVYVPELDEERLQYMNVSRVRTQGLQAGATASLYAGATVRANATYQSAEEAGSPRINAPKWLGSVALSAPLGVGWLRGALEANYVGSRRTRDPGVEVDAYTSLAATISLRGLVPWFSAHVAVRNALDEAAYDPAGDEHVPLGVRQDGRNASLQLTFRLPG
ncbi:MAG: TonB-dependent receptor [Candidatus Schekmanbacteria bacterium]|nr:TonB-dependent receptor [Candidatus Schekmanbacteria bacterium]